MRLLLCAAGAFLLLIGILLFHPFFRITESRIRLYGLARIDPREFIGAVAGIVQSRRWGILPGDRFPSVNIYLVRDIARERFPIASIEVRKTFPHFLDIRVIEKVSTILYDNGRQYSAVGLDGQILGLLRPVAESEWMLGAAVSSTTTTVRVHEPPVAALRKEYGDYPVVYDLRPAQELAVHTAVFSTSTAEGIERWSRVLSDEMHIAVSYMTLQNDHGDMDIRLREGWHIRARGGDAVERELEAFRALWRTIPKGQPLEYIDIRYPGRVYWR